MVVYRLQKTGSGLISWNIDGTKETLVRSGNLYFAKNNSDIQVIEKANNTLIIWYKNGSKQTATKDPVGLWYTGEIPEPPEEWFHPLGAPRPWTTYNDGGGSHSNGALDFGTQGATPPLYAAHHGKILRAGWESGGGGNVVIIEPTGGTGEGIVYAHMSRVDVSVGQTVEGNQIVGLVGATGTATGTHLHLEVRRNGVQWGPWYRAFDYFEDRGVYLGPQA